MVVKNPDPERALATLLFIDIVASTEMLADLGDQAWSELLDHHRQAVRGEIVRSHGREIDSVVTVSRPRSMALLMASAVPLLSSRRSRRWVLMSGVESTRVRSKQPRKVSPEWRCTSEHE